MSAVRHKASVKVKAMQLADAGWSVTDIQRILQSEGLGRPSRNTVWMWTSPKADARREQQRHRLRRGRKHMDTYRWPGRRTADWRVGRMRALRDAGLSWEGIATVMSVDFPEIPLSRHEVRVAVLNDRPPRALRGCLARSAA